MFKEDHLTQTLHALRRLTLCWLLSCGLSQLVVAQETANAEVIEEPDETKEAVEINKAGNVEAPQPNGELAESQPATSVLIDQVTSVPNVAPSNPPATADENTANDSATCNQDPPKQTFLDRLQEKLSEWSCSSASWADGLFSGHQKQYSYRETHGEVYLGGSWSQLNDFEKVLRFRARLALPNTRNRWHGFIGRVDRNEFVTESTHELHALPVAFDRNLRNSLLLGLGYEEPLKKRGALDADVGVPFDLPFDPYVKTSYRIGFPLGDSDLIRLRETLFWQKTERLGTTTRIDWDHVVSDSNLLRWTASATQSKAIDGWRWYSTLTWYEMLSPKHALAYELAASRNNTALSTDVDDYSVSTIYRHNFWRSWLWLEARLGVSWPFQEELDDRRSNLFTLFAFEMRFGGND
jgi:hypothetical protein